MEKEKEGKRGDKREGKFEWSHSSALMVGVPENLHKEINTIRKFHDKAFQRWMPHLNIMFPFVLDDLYLPDSDGKQINQAVEKLREGLRDFPSFLLEFEDLHSFPQGKSQTVHLAPRTEPETAFDDLYERLLKIFPNYLKDAKARQKLLPHLTIGQWSSKISINELEKRLNLSRCFSATILVDRLVVISRNGDVPFQTRFEIKLAEPSGYIVETLDLLEQNIDSSPLLPSLSATVYTPKRKKEERESERGEEERERGRERGEERGEDVWVKIVAPVEKTKERKEVIFVCDTSGSMSGTPKNQILKAVSSLEEEGLEFKIINYSTSAQFLTGTNPQLSKELTSKWQSGITNFRLAFHCMNSYLKSLSSSSQLKGKREGGGEREGTERRGGDSIDFVFMTDGAPSDAPLAPRGHGVSLHDLRATILQFKKATGRNVFIHSFGLGGQSRVDLLEEIRTSGTGEGVYVFASSRPGKQDDDQIITEAKQLLTFAGKAVELPVLVDDSPERFVTFYLDDESGGSDEVTMSGEMWVSQAPKKISLQLNSSLTEMKEIPNILKGVVGTDYHLALLQRDLYSPNGSERLIELEERLELIRKRAPKDRRKEVGHQLLEIQREIDEMRHLVAMKVDKKLCNQSELVARFKAMAFKGRMKKSRREKNLDKRTLANRGLMGSIEKKLGALPDLTEKELSDLEHQFMSVPPVTPSKSGGEEEAQDGAAPAGREELIKMSDLRDDIYEDTLPEILTGSKTNILMLGLMVERDEITVDQPTALRVTLGNTMVSWTTLEQAAQFQIGRGNKEATGTFDFSTVSKLLTGINAEVINAGLPLYCTPFHYARIRLLLPVLCGHFFALSPTAYAPPQIPALFAVLARLHRQAKSDRSRMIVEEFRKVCTEIMFDTELLETLRVPEELRPMTFLEKFCVDVSSHKKSELPTLDILYGAILAAQKPIETLGEGFGPILIAEIYRRQLAREASIQHAGPDAYASLVRRMVAGDHPQSAPLTVDSPPELKENGDFVPVKFSDFEPFPKMKELTKEMKKEVKVYKTVEYFITQTRAVGLENMTQKEYEDCLYFAILQAAFAPTNDRFRDLIDKKVAILRPDNPEEGERLYQHIHGLLNGKRKEKWNNQLAAQQSEEHATFLLHNLESVDQFVMGVKSFPNFSRGMSLWSELVSQIMPSETFELIPQRLGKLAVMLGGKDLESGEEVVYGGPWLAGPQHGPVIRERLKETEYEDLLDELDGMALQHRYRPSDIPNRHGHCNSFPLWQDDPSHPAVSQLMARWDR